MTTTTDEAVQVLLEAADLIRFGGLAKKILQDGDSFCTVGAVCHARGHVAPAAAVFDYDYVIETAFSAVTAEIGIAWALDIPAWNNAPERTADEVVDVLTRAAKRLANAEA